MKIFVPLMFVVGTLATQKHWMIEPRSSDPKAECTIDDHSNKSKPSWITNCPSSCKILQYLESSKIKINAKWKEIEQKMDGKLGKSSDGSDMHLTLQQIIIKLKEIMASMMTEKEQFEEIEKLYNSGDIPSIIAEQNIKTNALATKRTELQQKLIALKKGFVEQTGFCKVSFKEYNEEVCDIRSHAANMN